jgi:uncharacterized protein (TIGR00251 family)
MNAGPDQGAGLRIEAHPEGATVLVRAAPGASRERIVGVHGEALKIAVQAPPEKGRANERLAAVLAAAVDLGPRDVALLAGATGRDKRFLCRGLDPAELRRRVVAQLDS